MAASRAPDPPAPGRPGRWWLLDALHQLGPLGGRPLLVAHTFLAAASTPAERAAAAQLHPAQADQLRDEQVMGALARTHEAVAPLQYGRRAVLVADLLDAAPPELADAITAELHAAGLDPAARWPLPPWPS
jgi:hypothetical protein